LAKKRSCFNTKEHNRVRAQILALGIILVVINYFLEIPEETQMIIFGITIILTGIPHGSLDFYLAKQNQTWYNQPFSNKRFYFNYLLNMALFAVAWYISPFLSVLFFLFISAFHFGEIDFVNKGQAQVPWYLSSMYGLTIIVYIIACHAEESIKILHYLLPKIEISTITITLGKSFSEWILIISLISFFVINIVSLLTKSINNLIFKLINQTFCILLIIKFLPFYLAFAFYFGIWHSLLSFEAILQSLHLENTTEDWLKLMKKALPFSLLSFIGLAILIYMGFNGRNTPQIVSLLFIGISILTLPHFQVFSKALNKNRSTETNVAS